VKLATASSSKATLFYFLQINLNILNMGSASFKSAWVPRPAVSPSAAFGICIALGLLEGVCALPPFLAAPAAFGLGWALHGDLRNHPAESWFHVLETVFFRFFATAMAAIIASMSQIL